MLPKFSARTEDGRVPFRIRGSDIQTVEFELQPGDRVFAQTGTFVCGNGDIKIDVEWGKGLLDPVRRVLAGERGTLMELTCEQQISRAVIGAAQIGRIVHLHLDGTKSFFCDKGAYLAHSGDIDISIGIARKLRSGLFGGNGFVMQRLSGYGDVFLHATGSVTEWKLQEGATAIVNTQNLLAFEDTVGYDIQFTGGILSIWFAGQGLFLAKLQGPGLVVSNSINQDAYAKALKISSKKRHAQSKKENEK